MNESDDRVDAVLEAFLDYLDGMGDEPSLEDLDTHERERAEELIASLRAGRGMDPYASRPSLEQLLAGTPLEGALPLGQPVTSPNRDLIDKIRDRFTSHAPFRVDILRDTAAAASGIPSDFVALVGVHRFRIQIRDELLSAADLAALDPAAAAGLVYETFPDTAGVIALFLDDELSSVAIDPFDSEYCIETPAGTVARPTMHRPVMPLVDTVRSYFEELAPTLNATVGSNEILVGEVDPAHVARSAARRAVGSVVQDGDRAKIQAKRATWSSLGQPEIDAISDLVLDALGGLDQATLDSRIATISDAA